MLNVGALFLRTETELILKQQAGCAWQIVERRFRVSLHGVASRRKAVGRTTAEKLQKVKGKLRA